MPQLSRHTLTGPVKNDLVVIKSPDPYLKRVFLNMSLPKHGVTAETKSQVVEKEEEQISFPLLKSNRTTNEKSLMSPD